MSGNPPHPSYGYSSYGPYMIAAPHTNQYVMYSGPFPVYSHSNQFGHLSPMSMPVSRSHYDGTPVMQRGVYSPVAYVNGDAGRRQSDVAQWASPPVPPFGAFRNPVSYPVHKLTAGVLAPNGIAQKLEALQIKKKKYATSTIDPIRNYLTVFEYTLNGSWIMWDYDTGYVYWTGIWKAAFSDEANHPIKSKCDIVKLVDSTPKEYHAFIKRIRGGFLKIQGTWLPFSLCKILARGFCYYIRYELVPLFGNDFPSSCLKPTDSGFGDLRFDGTATALPRRVAPQAVASPPALVATPGFHRRAHSDTKRHRPQLDVSAPEFDIVEASRCLAALSSTAPENTYNNYTTSASSTAVGKREPSDAGRPEPNGISNILRAATMSEQPKSTHRGSIKINDLLD